MHAAGAELTVSIYSPEKKLLEEPAVSVGLPGKKGSFTVLKGHANLVAELEAGIVKVQTSTSTETYVVDSGFAEIKNNQVIVLVEGATNPAALDAAIERAALDEALNRPTENAVQYAKKQRDVALRRVRARVAESLKV
ncbi:MAG: ATP synthase F1 subunit epsilon [Spirochaetes bacterium]|nr:ATP synthase F1 subunit epsilon [Spirochaetota bacterium]